MAPNRTKKRKVAEDPPRQTIKQENEAGASSSKFKKEPELEEELYDGHYDTTAPPSPAKPIKKENINPRASGIPSGSIFDDDPPLVEPKSAPLKSEPTMDELPSLQAPESRLPNAQTPKVASVMDVDPPSSPVQKLPARGAPPSRSQKIRDAFESMWEDEDSSDDEQAEGSFDPYDRSREDDECFGDTLPNGRPCTIHVNFDGQCDQWLETIHVSITDGRMNAGHGIARFVKRSTITADFWDKMIDDEEGALRELAFEIFDRFGRLRKEFRDHPVRKGSGIWGAELDSGDFLVIDHIYVSKEWRDKGVDSLLMKHLRQKGNSGSKTGCPDLARYMKELGIKDVPSELLKSDGHAHSQRQVCFEFFMPSWFASRVMYGVAPDERKYARESGRTNVSLIRRLGYRRVGISKCFAFASDKSHPSRMLSASNDFDPATAPFVWHEQEGALERMDDARVEWIQKLKTETPLVWAALGQSDEECLAFLKTCNIPPNHPSWSQTEGETENILHSTAKRMMPKSTQWLIDNVDRYHDLSLRRTFKGYTPFEILAGREESHRLGFKCEIFGPASMSDMFTGTSRMVLPTLVALKGGSVSVKEVERLKFGCTCVSCVGGFISQRMCLALTSHANLIHQMLEYGVDDGPVWTSMHEPLLKHVKPDMKQKLRADKVLRQGFRVIFEQVSICLGEGTPPTVVAVQKYAALSSSTKKYIKRGGKVEDALRALFEKAKHADKLAGTGEGWEKYGKESDNLAECRNDSEFVFIANMCGVPRLGYPQLSR